MGLARRGGLFPHRSSPSQPALHPPFPGHWCRCPELVDSQAVRLPWNSTALEWDGAELMLGCSPVCSTSWFSLHTALRLGCDSGAPDLNFFPVTYASASGGSGGLLCPPCLSGGALALAPGLVLLGALCLVPVPVLTPDVALVLVLGLVLVVAVASGLTVL